MPVERRKTIPAGLMAAAMVVAIVAASQSSLLHVRPPARDDAADGRAETAARLLGFTAEPVDAAHTAVVTSVASHGAARRAGLRIGDVVIAVDGQRADAALSTLRRPPHELTIRRRGVARTLVLR